MFLIGLEAFELGNLRKTRAGIELRAFSNTLVNAAAKANMAVYRERQGDDRTANKIWQDLFGNDVFVVPQVTISLPYDRRYGSLY